MQRVDERLGNAAEAEAADCQDLAVGHDPLERRVGGGIDLVRHEELFLSWSGAPRAPRCGVLWRSVFSQNISQPWLSGETIGLEGGDLVGVTQGQLNLVQALQQTFPLEGRNLEVDSASVRKRDTLVNEVYRQGVASVRDDVIQHLPDDGWVQRYRQHSVLEHIGSKDLSE